MSAKLVSLPLPVSSLLATLAGRAALSTAGPRQPLPLLAGGQGPVLAVSRPLEIER